MIAIAEQRPPLIVVCAPEHPDVLRAQLARYEHEYDVRYTASSAETVELLTGLDHDQPVAMLVAETEVPDTPVLRAMYDWRAVVPTRQAASSPPTSTTSAGRAEELRPGLATGKYDAYLLMPRGVRDEEFHTALTELLSDWGSASPVVPTAIIVSPELDPLTVALRDFAYQMGMPAQVVTPDSEAGRHVCELHGDDSRFPIVKALGGITSQPRSVRELAATIYGAPDQIDVDKVVDLVVVGAGPGRAGRGRLRLLGGAEHRGARDRGRRRTGRHQLDDPQLPRLPAGHLRHAAGPARPQPGDPLRHQVLHRLAGRGPRARARRRAAPRRHRRRRGARARGRDLLRRRLPPPRRRRLRGPGRARRALRRRR